MAYHDDIANDKMTELIIGKAIEIHKGVGPGWPEEHYQELLFDELEEAGLDCQCEHEVPITYKGKSVGVGYADLYVEQTVVLELKVVKTTTEAHFQQLGRYVRALNATRGLLLNFGSSTLITRRYTNFKAQAEQAEEAEEDDRVA
ncbi:MAG: GxxExxY protein [Persicimonas sp.]